MVNNNNYPPVDLPKTYTVAYFDEVEWNKDLSWEEQRLNDLIYDNYLDEIKAQELGYGSMPKWWCIKCQSQQDHEYDYCHNSCGNNCVHRCKNCKLETLANISEPSVGDSSGDMVRQAVAQAQRQALATNKTSGIIEINMSCGNAGDGYYRTQILMYDTKTKDYRVAYRS